MKGNSNTMKKIYLILIIFAVLIGLCNISKAAEIKKGIENFIMMRYNTKNEKGE